MRLPSVKTLLNLGISELQASLCRVVLEKYSNPQKALDVISETILSDDGSNGFHGVECIRSEKDTMYEFHGIEYLNTGETYQTTLLYDYHTQTYRVQSWGDCVEIQERNGRKFL